MVREKEEIAWLLNPQLGQKWLVDPLIGMGKTEKRTGWTREEEGEARVIVNSSKSERFVKYAHRNRQLSSSQLYIHT
jgi:hypothetical protein